MLIEGIDNTIIYASLVIGLLLLIIMINLGKRMFSVEQINPQIHTESQNDVNRFRDEVLNNNTNENEADDANGPRRRHANRNINCPICLSVSLLPIETNCGHIFCSSCIIQYWRHMTANIYHSKMQCPMCRQSVTCLLPLYSRQEQEQAANEYGEIFTQIKNYNRRFSGAPRNFLDYVSDIPILLRHVINELFSFNDLGIWYRIRFGFLIIASFCYFISPLDIIPEALFGLFGLFDDFLIIIFLVFYICSLYRQVIANR